MRISIFAEEKWLARYKVPRITLTADLSVDRSPSI
jgi:hypothetical protein